MSDEPAAGARPAGPVRAIPAPRGVPRAARPARRYSLSSAEPAAGARPAGPVRAIPAPRGVLRALRSRNFRLYFGGQSLSLIGALITRVATSWLVYRLTGSLLLLGVVGFFSQIPTLLLAPFAGVLVDRWDRHRILVITQVLSMLQSAALAWLTFAGIITVVD